MGGPSGWLYHLDSGKASRSPQSSGALSNQNPPYHSASSSWFSYFIYNFYRQLLRKQRKVWIGFSVVLFLICILAIPSSLIGKDTRGKRRPTASLSLALLWGRGPCTSLMLLIFHVGQAEPQLLVNQEQGLVMPILSLLESPTKKKNLGFPPFSLLRLNLAFSLRVSLFSRKVFSDYDYLGRRWSDFQIMTT